ncbi:hypothetical protein AOLI_G00135250 [Acnodon oligacanthus]
MAERRLLTREDDQCSLLSKLGTDSPKPRVKFGGMFCNIEGAFENKTLNFESFSPDSVRRSARRLQDSEDSASVSDVSSVSGVSSVSRAPPQPPVTRSQTVDQPVGQKRSVRDTREEMGFHVL